MYTGPAALFLLLLLAGCAGPAGTNKQVYEVETIESTSVVEKAAAPTVIPAARREAGQSEWIVPFRMAASVLDAAAFPALGDYLTGYAEFRWEGDEPLTFHTLDDGLAEFGRIEIYDENGKALGGIGSGSPRWGPRSEPIQKGETVKVRVFWLTTAFYPRPGRYYAVASFGAYDDKDSSVRFRTTPYWFEVRARR